MKAQASQSEHKGPSLGTVRFLGLVAIRCDTETVLTTRPSSRGSEEDCMMSGGMIREKGRGKL